MRLSTPLQVLLALASIAKAAPASSASLPPSATLTPIPYPTSEPKWSLSTDDIPSGKALLSQEETNGRSLLGTFDAKTFEKFKAPKNAQKGAVKVPWSGKSANNTNTFADAPDTGKVQSYNWTVERAVLAPDGVSRPMILVNGAFPGPTIEANWGDTISVTIHNKITGPEEGTSFHWHGFLQKDTPFQDGVPGVTQCPIAPGQSYTYTFKADSYGTSWWHSHFSSQYAGGLFGAMVIHGPNQDESEAQYDADLGPIILSDYYHQDYFTLLKNVMGTDIKKALVKSDNNLINGKGIFDCNSAGGPPPPGKNTSVSLSCTSNAGLSKFSFTSGQTYRLRLINSGSEGLQKFSIDNHDMTVIAYDFIPIQPYQTKVVTLGVGQRADVLVKANQDPSTAYWMRSTMGKCSLTNQPNGLAIVYYEKADTNSNPTTTAQEDTTNPCGNDDLSMVVPYYPMEPPATPDVSQSVDLTFGVNATGNILWTLNNSTFRANYNTPILPMLQNGSDTSTFPKEWNTYNFGAAKSIRITINNNNAVAHPMHMHGHNFYVLSSTNYTSANPVTVRPSNPVRRDTQVLEPNGQLVIQIDADNPGVWPFHCHVAWHVSAGLYMNIVERPDDIKSLKSPAAVSDLCTSWSAYTASQVPDQIDSGLKAKRNVFLRALGL